MRSTSSLLRPEDDVIVTFWSLPVALSFAVTFKMPLASISNVTSICGTPRGAGGMPLSLNFARVRFCAASGRSPCRTWTSTSCRASVRSRREGFGLLGRDRGVALNHPRCNATQGFDGQCQRRYVEQQQVLHFAREHASLYRCANRNYFVRIYALVRFLAEELLHQRLNARHARLSAHEHNFIDLARVHSRIRQSLLAWLNGAL